jgi:hypothetical protein
MAASDGGIGYGGVDSAPTGLRRSRRISHEAGLLGGGILILVGAFIYPYLEGIADTITPGCLFHRITGLPCLLCGMTRSLAATAHGHLGDAFRMHLLGPPLFLAITVVSVALMAEFVMSRRILPRPSERAWKSIAWATLGMLTVAWVARLVFFGVNI